MNLSGVRFRIEARREALGLTQQEVERATGMQGYQDMEYYDNEILNVPSIDRVSLLMNVLNTTLAELLEIECAIVKSVDIQQILLEQLESRVVSLDEIAEKMGYYIEGVQGLTYGALDNLCLLDVFILAEILGISDESMICYISGRSYSQ